MNIESVAVVGGGFMGVGIAESAAVAGLPVVVRDIDQPSIDRARQRLESSLERAVAGDKLDAAHAAVARDRIELTTDLGAISPADLVIEAVPEDERLKLEVMDAIDGVVSDSAIVASNTSSIPIAQLAQAIKTPRAGAGAALLLPGAGDDARRGRRRARHQRADP